ncbi:MAG TPA: type II toxin-antitoxin system prevent-host-death family antitoxin [Streptosporangiaceae bacterium]|nr:type II toxin-antitoxin system prevent-host-death family antitoxin [Streptosporangiaceae bacterium]
MESVGAYEAKTHLPRLLEAVAAGQSVTITKHGIPVARLVPAYRERPPASEVIRSLRKARQGVTLGGLSIADLINEGRR